MTVNFQQVREQIYKMGEQASLSEQRLQEYLKKALEVLEKNANNLDILRDKVRSAVVFNPNLRSALPLHEPLSACYPVGSPPNQGSLLAADGSQINPDRHASVDYCLVNVGAIQVSLENKGAPTPTIQSRLLYAEEMYTPFGRVTEQWVALMRDISERKLLAELAEGQQGPIITLTDGPLELWIGRETQFEQEYKDRFNEYLHTLKQMKLLNASTAGYVDKPGSDLVVRLVEIAEMDLSQLNEAVQHRTLQGLTDSEIFSRMLQPGERSAVFGIQSKMSIRYPEDIALHFFYLNVGREGHPYVVRVEIPAWVSQQAEMLGELHAVLVSQCRALGARPYPYLLHRAHEVAVVSKDEKEQIENMIAVELRQRGLDVGSKSSKQSAKDVTGNRKRY